jgi:hypothetical protein
MRVELVPLAQSYLGHFWTKAPPTPPPLVLEFDDADTVRVIDPETTAVLASTSRTHVNATPAQHKSSGGDGPTQTDPLLIVTISGLDPLRIRPAPTKYGIKYPSGDYRYSWRDMKGGPDRPPPAEQAGYGVAEADWVALIDTFGLTSRMVDTTAPEYIAERSGGELRSILTFVAVLVLLAALMAGVHFFAR